MFRMFYIPFRFLPPAGWKFSIFPSWEKSISRQKNQVHLIIQFPLYYRLSGHLWELKCREKFRKIGHTTCFFLIASVKWYMKYFIYHNSICVPSLSFLRQSRKTKRKRWENIILSSGFYLYHLIITPSHSYCTTTFTDINRYRFKLVLTYSKLKNKWKFRNFSFRSVHSRLREVVLKYGDLPWKLFAFCKIVTLFCKIGSWREVVSTGG